MIYDFNNILNRTIESINLSDDRSRITLKFQDGFSKSYGVEGDCCSSSWIEHLEAPDDINGARLLRVEESDGVPFDGHVCVGYDYSKTDEENKAAGACGHDTLQVYNTKFHTDRGTVTLEYRNDSNGYYGGYLVDAD
jgi:hypothetical protein